MNRTLVAFCALLLAGSAGAAPPSKEAPASSNAVAEESIVSSADDARHREMEIRLKVLEHEDPKVQAEFAVMMEELDQSTPATAPEAPQPAR